MIRSLRIVFIAYKTLVCLCSTKKTLPKPPSPICFLTSKSVSYVLSSIFCCDTVLASFFSSSETMLCFFSASCIICFVLGDAFLKASRMCFSYSYLVNCFPSDSSGTFSSLSAYAASCSVCVNGLSV